MPEYEFGPCDNGNCPDRRGKVTFYVIQYRMGDAPRIGERRECPCCGQGAITRLASLPSLIVKEADGRKTTGNRFITNLAGRETHLQFIDHRHTDPHHESAMLEAARRNGLKGAYYNQRHGKVCVDVLSNVKDPLGKMKKAGGEGGQITSRSETTKVNTAVKIRKSNPNAKPNTTLKPFAPTRKH